MKELWRLRAGMASTVVRVAVVLFLAYAVACGVIVHAAFRGDITFGTVAVLLPLLMMTMVGGGVSFDDLSLEWQLSAFPELASVERELADTRRAMSGDRDPASHPTRSIRFEAVSFRYPQSQSDVIQGLDLEIVAGRSTAVVGANGVGKTTLVKLLARLHDPTAGRILVDDEPLERFDPEAWQRNVAVVFQDFAHLPLTAAENIGLGSPTHLGDRQGIVDAAELAGARDLIESLPNGLDTPLSKQRTGGVDLSGGEWQRVALARALFASRHGASVLVLDEPTSWLDVRGEAEFFERFLEITAGLTTVVISHRFSTVRLADQIVVVRGGKVVERGSHEELMQLDVVYARMFRLQAARFVDDTERIGV
jgi:ATP-binding cassette subfamily B protein